MTTFEEEILKIAKEIDFQNWLKLGVGPGTVLSHAVQQKLIPIINKIHYEENKRYFEEILNGHAIKRND